MEESKDDERAFSDSSDSDEDSEDEMVRHSSASNGGRS